MSRTYRDPIHSEIHLNSEDPVEKLLIDLIDTCEVQRLRWIHQLGTSWYTFHGAEASRFPHSIGAMHIGRKMLDHIYKDLDFDAETKQEHYAITLSAALLHDIGHGPFSHSCESITNIKHEHWSLKLIQSPDSEVNKVLRAFDPSLPDKVISLFQKTYSQKFLCNIVSSQIDCDRFDYLIRDSHNTGTAYGNFDLDRVIGHIQADLDNDCLVISSEKGMLAVEDYLYARYSMYLQVYQHKKCLATDVLYQKLFKRVKTLMQTKRIAYLEGPVARWLQAADQLSVQDYLHIDDICILHHIKRWCHEKDYILKDLAKRFMHRKLFKATRIKDPSQKNQMYQEELRKIRAKNLDPEYYLDTVRIASNPYSFYNPDTRNNFKAIFVRDRDCNNNLKEISEMSHVVDAMVKKDFETNWLISI